MPRMAGDYRFEFESVANACEGGNDCTLVLVREGKCKWPANVFNRLVMKEIVFKPPLLPYEMKGMITTARPINNVRTLTGVYSRCLKKTSPRRSHSALHFSR